MGNINNMERKTSVTYRILCLLGFKYPVEDYGNISLWNVVKQFFTNWYHRWLINAMNYAILEPFNPRKLRPAILRKLGAHVGKDVFIGDYVREDFYGMQPYKYGKIHLQRNCAIGTGCIVMPGVTVGEGAVVGAGSLVTRDIPVRTLAVGRPANVEKSFGESAIGGDTIILTLP